jgi:hypothetical protein
LALQAISTCPTIAESWIIMSLASQKDTEKSLVFIEKVKADSLKAGTGSRSNQCSCGYNQS